MSTLEHSGVLVSTYQLLVCARERSCVLVSARECSGANRGSGANEDFADVLASKFPDLGLWIRALRMMLGQRMQIILLRNQGSIYSSLIGDLLGCKIR